MKIASNFTRILSNENVSPDSRSSRLVSNAIVTAHSVPKVHLVRERRKVQLCGSIEFTLHMTWISTRRSNCLHKCGKCVCGGTWKWLYVPLNGSIDGFQVLARSKIPVLKVQELLMGKKVNGKPREKCYFDESSCTAYSGGRQFILVF